MTRRLPIAAALFAVVHLAAGCAGQSRSFVRTENVYNLQAEKIVQVTLKSGEVVHFDGRGARYYEEYQDYTHVIVGRTNSGELVAAPLEQVQQAMVERIVDDEIHVDVFPALIITGLAVAVLANGAQR